MNISKWAYGIVALLVVGILVGTLFPDILAYFYDMPNALVTYNNGTDSLENVAPTSHMTILELIPLFLILGVLMTFVTWRIAKANGN